MNRSDSQGSRRRVHLAPERLEERSLLSVSGHPAQAVAPPAHVAPASVERITLDGTVRGTLRRFQGATIGAEAAFVLSGAGQHATVGRARVDGFMMPSSVEANPSATLTLKTTRGSVTLALQAPPQSSARPALVYLYTVQQGTGAYRGVTGSGTAYLTLPRGLPRGPAASAPFTFLLQSDRIRG